MWCLGRFGRFGNQLLQYAFLRVYAELHGLDIETPRWIGQEIFGFRDSRLGRTRRPAVDAWIRRYARRRELGVFVLQSLLRWMWESWPEPFEWVEFDHEILAPERPPLTDVYFWGTFLFPTRHYRAHRDFIRALYQPVLTIENRLRPMTDALRARGRTIIGVHVRLGDFWQFADCNWAFIAPAEWYVQWLEEVWAGLDDPVLVLCSDEPEKIRHYFARFEPVTATDLDAAAVRDMGKEGFGFYPDFHLLRNCDVLAISSSTFGLLPAMLNERCERFYRADADAGRVVPFDPWNCDVYPDRVDEARMKTLSGRLAYRARNLKRMAVAHGTGTLLRGIAPRLHRRVLFDISAIAVSGFMLAMRVINRASRRRLGRAVSPEDVFRSRRLLTFFTNSFNK